MQAPNQDLLAYGCGLNNYLLAPRLSPFITHIFFKNPMS